MTECTELATLGGVTYVSIPDDVAIGEQPTPIAESIQPVTLTAELIDEISDASPHVWLIRKRVAEAIAERYAITDEIKLLRTAPSAEFDAYNAYAESCRAWGREEKTKLGLVLGA